MSEIGDLIQKIRAAIRQDKLPEEPHLRIPLETLLFRTDDDGSTFLHYCAKKGAYKSAEYLLKLENSDSNKVQDARRYMVKNQKRNIGRVMTEMDAQNFDETQMLAASSNSKRRSFRKSRRNLLPGIANNYGFLPLHYAASNAKQIETYENQDDNENQETNARRNWRKVKFWTKFINLRNKRISTDQNVGDETYQIQEKHVKMLQVLLDHEINNNKFQGLSARDPEYKITALHEALIKRNDIAAEMMIDYIDVNFKAEDSLDLEKEKNILFKKLFLGNIDNHKQNLLHYCGIYGCPRSLESILSKLYRTEPDENYLLITDDDSKTPLHFAAMEGHEWPAKFMIRHEQKHHNYVEYEYQLNFEKKLKPLSQLQKEDKTGFLPIHLGIESGNDNIVKYLLEKMHKILPEEVFHKILDKKLSEGGYNAICLAAKNDLDHLRMLFEDYKANVNVTNNDGNNILMIAAEENEPVIVNYILENEDVEININDVNMHDQTALMLAAKEGNYEVVDVILKHSNTVSSGELNMAQVDSNGQNVIHLIAANGPESGQIRREETALEFLAMLEAIKNYYGKQNENDFLELCEQYDEDGNTPIHLAAEVGFLEIIKLLIEGWEDGPEHGVEPSPSNVYDEIPLMMAIINNKFPVVEYFVQISQLDDENDNLADEDEDANTALHLAAQYGHYDIVQLLVETSASMDATNQKQETPLDLAAKNGHTEICRFLIERGSPIDPLDKNNKTPLMLAAENGHSRTLQYLLSSGATAYKVTAEKKKWEELRRTKKETIQQQIETGRRNVLEIALENNHKECVKVILLSDVWMECLRNANFAKRGQVITPMRTLVDTYPDLASIVLNRSIEYNQHEDKARLNFEFIEDLYRVEGWNKAQNEEVGDDEDHLTKSNLGPKFSLAIDSFVGKLHDSFRGAGDGEEDEVLNGSESSEDIVSGSSKTGGTYQFNYNSKGQLKPDCEMYQFEYQIRKKSNDTGHFTESPVKQRKLDSLGYRNQHVLTHIARSKDVTLLRHPLVLKLIEEKWEAYGKYVYWADFILYVIFLIAFNVYAMMYTPPSHLFDDASRRGTLNSTDKLAHCQEIQLNDYTKEAMQPGGHMYDSYTNTFGDNAFDAILNKHFCENPSESSWLTTRFWLQNILGIAALSRILIELSNLKNYGIRNYFSDGMNYIELMLYTFTFIYLNDKVEDGGVYFFLSTKIEPFYVKTDGQMIFGTFAILLSWLNLLMFIRKFPKFGLYVLMFEHVLKTFMEFFTVLLIFIFAFTCTFRMILGNRKAYHKPMRDGLLSTLVMMIGELDYGDKMLGSIPDEPQAPGAEIDYISQVHLQGWSQLVYCMFLILMGIIVMNLMTGLAVDDIGKIREKAEIKKLAMLIDSQIIQEFELPNYSFFKKLKVKGNLASKEINYLKSRIKKYRKRNFMVKFFEDERHINPTDYVTAAGHPLWQPTTEEDIEDLEHEEVDHQLKEFEILKSELKNIKRELEYINRRHRQESGQDKNMSLAGAVYSRQDTRGSVDSSFITLNSNQLKTMKPIKRRRKKQVPLPASDEE